MNLPGRQGNCTEDFIQFGRDVLFITTHLRFDNSILSAEVLIFQFSDKLCGKILSKLSWAPSISSEKTLPARNYIEDSDTEMDIWIYMIKSPDFKSLSLLITPFRKICDPKDHFYRACHKQNRLVAFFLLPARTTNNKLWSWSESLIGLIWFAGGVSGQSCGATEFQTVHLLLITPTQVRNLPELMTLFHFPS